MVSAPNGSTDEAPSDAEILQRARNGDEQAWAALYETLHRPLLGYLRARGCPDPEDALGEVFLRLARSLSRFEGGLPGLKAYAFTVAQNYLIDSARARKARPQLTFLVPEALLAEAGNGGPPVASAEDDALAALDMSELAAALAELTPQQQHVLYLRVIGDQSIREVARAVGKSPGAVKQLHFRAMERLRQALERGPSKADAEAKE